MATSFVALMTMLFITGTGVSIGWLIAAIIANTTTVTFLIAELVNSKAVFKEDILLLHYGLKKRAISYSEIQKAVATKRGVLLWREIKRPWDIWLKEENKDIFLAELYKYSPSLKCNQEEAHAK